MWSNDRDKLPAAAIAIPLFSVSAILLELPPFLWHLRNRNFGASCMIAYFFLWQIMSFINAIIWPRDSALERFDGRGLCDVEVRFQLLAYIGIPASIFCIMRRLASIVDTERATAHDDTKGKRRMIEDALLCLGFPVFINALYYIVQPSRFRLYTVVGCKWTIAYSWPSILVVQMWPIVFSLINAYLAVVVLYRLYIFNRSGVPMLFSNSSMKKSRFMRLFAISFILILVVLPISIQALVLPVRRGYVRYSWYRIHYIDWDIEKFPTGGRIGALESDAIIAIVAGYLIFLCFGLGKDAVDMYRSWAQTLGLLRWMPCLRERPRSDLAPADFFDTSGSTTTTGGHITIMTTYGSKSETEIKIPTAHTHSPSKSSYHDSAQERDRSRRSSDSQV